MSGSAALFLLFSAALVGVSNGFSNQLPLLSSSTGRRSRRHNSLNNIPHNHQRGRTTLLFDSVNQNNKDEVRAEAERLLARAKAIREEIGEAAEKVEDSLKSVRDNSKKSLEQIQSDFSLPSTSTSSSSNTYRLYLNIGREPGTWMDPRWGASGNRIECTVDVSFSSPKNYGSDTSKELSSSSEEIASALIKTVTTKSSKLSPVCKLQHAPFARLRRGFDKMKIVDGAYCIESASKSSTLRFCLSVSGTADATGGGSYGDVNIPEGKLYFALPFFGIVQKDNDDGSGDDDLPRMSISNKEGTICVKQIGWHTGWRREESRILGVFRAIPLKEARRRDKF